MILNTQIYIGSNRIDLFDDERITLNRQVKTFQDIDKIFTDYTQGFTIPASQANNKAMEHWYNADITGSFNPAVKIAGRIELNYVSFKSGVFSLDSVKLKNGKPDSYTITFYGDLRSMAETFGEDYLTSLDLSSQALAFSSFGNAMVDRVLTDSVLIPMISPSREFTFGDHTSDVNSIKYDNGGQNYGILYEEVKPAVQIKKILDAIETKYSLTFNSTFFDSTHFGNIFMWGHKEAGKTRTYGSSWTRLTTVSTTEDSTPPTEWDTVNGHWTVTQTTGSATNTYTTSIQIATGDADAAYDVLWYDDNSNQVLLQVNGLSGSGVRDFLIARPTDATDHHVFLAIRSQVPLTVNFSVITNFAANVSENSITTSVGTYYFTDDTFTDSLTGDTISVTGNLPQMKVGNFMQGLINMFNLVIVPTGATTFDVEPLDDWYSNGSTRRYDQFIDSSNYDVMSPDIFGRIFFKYSDPESGPAKQYKENNGGEVGYGDLISSIVDSNGDPLSTEEFNIELPFSNPVWEKLKDSSGNNEDTDILVSDYINKEGEAVLDKPVLFYYADQISVASYSYATKTKTGASAIERTTYNLCYQFNTADDSFTKSLNFGTEINPYTLNDGVAADPTLFNEYWEDYITDIYDLTRRKYTFKGVLPLGRILELELNDKIRIGSRLFKINSLRIELTTGETTFELFNEIA
jgi:hypothetical protein